ncbi:MAG: rod shape-determining protein MreC [Verrucomicrobiota bacterium]|jgi:rod shape-determining protein MreC
MNRLNLIALAIFTGLLVWVFLFDSPTTRLIQTRANAVFSSFKRSGAEVQGALTGSHDPRLTPEQLQARADQLTIENAELRVHRSRIAQLETEVQELERLLGFIRRQDTSLIPARLIARKTSAWYRRATIDKGRNQGVLDGSPVVVPTGAEGRPSLVGRVGRADADEAEIVFITDEECKVAARIEGTTERGILEGTRVSTSRRPELRLRWLPRNASVQQGRKVLSWDNTNRFPPDILLGTVIDFRDGDASSEAVVEPAVNLDELPFVLVMQLVPEDDHPPPTDAPR